MAILLSQSWVCAAYPSDLVGHLQASVQLPPDLGRLLIRVVKLQEEDVLYILSGDTFRSSELSS